MPHLCEPGTGSLSIVVQQPRPGVRLVRAGGDVDIDTAPRLRSAALDAAGGAGHALVVDLGAVTFLAAAGLAALLECSRAVETLVLIHSDHDAVRRPLVLTGLDEVLPRYPSLDAALAALR